MSYRLDDEPKHHKPELRTVQDTVTLSTVFVQNGTIFEVACPCWYLEVERPRRAHCHDRKYHDHVGWPSPRHPDHVCQSWDFAHSCCSHDAHKHHCDHCHMYLDMGRLIPIHLKDEGYTTVRVAMDDAPEGLKVSGRIDSRDDWIIRLTIEAKVASAIKEKKKCRFTVFIDGKFEDRNVTDVIATGKIVVLPGPYA